jgi:PAS domain S-box-containing protein
MSASTDLEKIKVIYQRLFEIAIGQPTDFTSETNPNDEFDVILNTIHSLAHQLQHLTLALGTVPPYYPYQNSTQLLIVLDEHYRIQNYNSEVVRLLYYNPDDLLGVTFDEIISEPSTTVWKSLLTDEVTNTFYTTLKLLFLTKDRHLFPAYCSVSRLHQGTALIVTSLITSINKITVLESSSTEPSTGFAGELEKLQNLHRYILEHLDEPLPTLKELAKLFGSEEHKLKVGFREHYHTSVYHFYQEERLKKAHSLILQTSLSLKEIAFMCGFTTYLNFYKAFKKQYDYAPSDLSRPHSKRD